MKKLCKKLLVLLLVVSMMLSVMPLSVFAGEIREDQVVEQKIAGEEEKNAMSDLTDETENEKTAEQEKPDQTKNAKPAENEKSDQTGNDESGEPTKKLESIKNQQSIQVMQTSSTEPASGESSGNYLAWENDALIERQIPLNAKKFSSLKSHNDVYILEDGETYVVDQPIDASGKTLKVIGGFQKVRLILMDDCMLTVKNIEVENLKGLEICGQSGNTGKLIADATNAAGIPAIGVKSGGKLWGNRVIGIYGGNFEAVGGQNAAGIGTAPETKWGGRADLTINIAGNAKVTAKGYAAIGAGKDAETSKVKVNVTMESGGDISPELTMTGEEKAINAEKDNIAFKLGEGYAFKSGDDETKVEVCEDESFFAEKATGSKFVRIDKPAEQNAADSEIPVLNESAQNAETYRAYENGQWVDKPIPSNAVNLSTLRSKAYKYRGLDYIDLDNNGVFVLDQDLDWSLISLYPKQYKNGNITIILKDNYTLKVRTVANYSYVTLNIYGQNNNTGKLIANASDDPSSPGIGTAYHTGTHHAAWEKSGPINIYGGTIDATGGKFAAGIGGNGVDTVVDEENRCSGPINIYGGNITAVGGGGGLPIFGWASGAGIGSGALGENIDPIMIYGGDIFASNGINLINSNGTAAIGSGNRTHYRNNRIEILGGKVTARSGDAAAIGTGSNTLWGDNGECHITIGGNADVTTISNYASIGLGKDSNANAKTSVNIEGQNVKVSATSRKDAHTVEAQNITIKDIKTLHYKDKLLADWIWERDPQMYVDRVKNKAYIEINGEAKKSSIPYIDPMAEVQEKECANAIQITEATRELKLDNGADGWYYVDDEVEIQGDLTVTGWEVKLILIDDASLSAERIKLGTHSSLRVYAQEENTGELEAKAIYGENVEGTLIGLYGGEINATGEDGHPGIGFIGGTFKDINTVEIKRAEVTAVGGINYPGIGVRNTLNNQLWIFGGTVNATGEGNAPGIGAINGCTGTSIRIEGGDVTAEGSGSYPGIGGDVKSSIGVFNIKLEDPDSKLKAIGGRNRAIGVRDDILEDKPVINSDQVLVGPSEEEAQKTAYLEPEENRNGVQSNKVALINYPMDPPTVQTMTIGDQMTVNLTTDIPEEGRNSSGVMQFEISGMDSPNIQVEYNDVFDATDSKGRITFRCPVRPDQMADRITAVYRYRDDYDDEFKFIFYNLMTAEKYLVNVTEDESVPEKTRDFAYALGQYGYHVQHELQRINGWYFIPTQHREIESFSEPAKGPEDNYQSYREKGENVPKNISIRGSGLVFNSIFGFNINVVDSLDRQRIDREVTVKLGDEVIPSSIQDYVGQNAWRIRIPQINVMNWSDELTVEVTVTYRGGKKYSWTMTSSPMAFGRYVNPRNQTQKRAIDAVWNLNQKALEYREGE